MNHINSAMQHQGPTGTSRRVVCVIVLLLCWAPLAIAEEQSEGSRYALLVGVSDYDGKELRPLQYTRNDILELSRALMDSGFDQRNIVVMHDDIRQVGNRRYLAEAFKIRHELSLLLAALQPADTLVVAFAGHGVQFRGEAKSYFCPINASLADRSTLIALEDIYEALHKSRAARKVLLVDACRNDPLSQRSRSRSTIDLESVTRPQEEQIPTGIVALFSCSPTQQSFEHPDLQHGVFFYHVIKGLRGAADTNKDRKVSLGELANYSTEETQTYVRLKFAEKQNPQLKAEASVSWLLGELSASEPSNWKNALGMEFVRIPAGTFLMGSVAGEGYDNEHPQHSVEISQPFYIARTEVTQRQYQSVMEHNPSWFSVSGRGRRLLLEQGITEETDTAEFPVEMVSYEDAVRFCDQMNLHYASELGRYRLPTEAEWEYVASWSSPGKPVTLAVDQSAWFEGNSQRRTWPVGQKRANDRGLFDMGGNVREWCSDWYDETFYRESPLRDPQGPDQPGVPAMRVLRGGSWLGRATACRPTDRNAAPPADRLNCHGFRVVVAPAAELPSIP